MADGEKHSKVWAHFVQLNDNTAKCNVCKKVVACKGGNTSYLLKHLHFQHSLNLKQCGVFDSLGKAATASATSSVQPRGSNAESSTASTSSSLGNKK